MRCQKCGFEQDDTGECARCGVIFAKIRELSEPGPTPSHVGLSPGALHHDLPSGGRGDSGRKLILAVCLFVVLGLLCHRLWITREIKYPPGVLVKTEPLQVVIKNPVPWKKEKRTVVPLAVFLLKARVLSKEEYRFDSGADISPIDLALGWRLMSDQKILDQLDITQGDRCFSIVPIVEKLSVPIHVLLAQSSNMHILPASVQIEKKVRALRIGALVELGGYLVGVQENGQWSWVSSLSRTDTGMGACEVFWVDRVEPLPLQ